MKCVIKAFLVVLATMIFVLGPVLILAIVVATPFIMRGNPPTAPPSLMTDKTAKPAIQGQCPELYPIKTVFSDWYYPDRNYYMPDTKKYVQIKAFACYDTEVAAQAAGFHRPRNLLQSLINARNVEALLVLVAFFLIGLVASREWMPRYGHKPYRRDYNVYGIPREANGRLESLLPPF